MKIDRNLSSGKFVFGAYLFTNVFTIVRLDMRRERERERRWIVSSIHNSCCFDRNPPNEIDEKFENEFFVNVSPFKFLYKFITYFTR